MVALPCVPTVARGERGVVSGCGVRGGKLNGGMRCLYLKC